MYVDRYWVGYEVHTYIPHYVHTYLHVGEEKLLNHYYVYMQDIISFYNMQDIPQNFILPYYIRHMNYFIRRMCNIVTTLITRQPCNS